MPNLKIGKIDSLIWKEFRQDPPEERAAKKLWELGYTEEILPMIHIELKTVLPKDMWVKTMNALRDIENNVTKTKNSQQKERRA